MLPFHRGVGAGVLSPLVWSPPTCWAVPHNPFYKESAGSQGTLGKCMGQPKLYKPVFLPELKGARLFPDKCRGGGGGEGRRKGATLGGLAHCRSTARGSRGGGSGTRCLLETHTRDLHTPQSTWVRTRLHRHVGLLVYTGIHAGPYPRQAHAELRRHAHTHSPPGTSARGTHS